MRCDASTDSTLTRMLNFGQLSCILGTRYPRTGLQTELATSLPQRPSSSYGKGTWRTRDPIFKTFVILCKTSLTSISRQYNSLYLPQPIRQLRRAITSTSFSFLTALPTLFHNFSPPRHISGCDWVNPSPNATHSTSSATYIQVHPKAIFWMRHCGTHFNFRHKTVHDLVYRTSMNISYRANSVESADQC